jgi:hypothetical protein
MLFHFISLNAIHQKLDDLVGKADLFNPKRSMHSFMRSPPGGRVAAQVLRGHQKGDSSSLAASMS